MTQDRTFPALEANGVYGLPQFEKERLLLSELNELDGYHQGACPEYRAAVEGLFPERATSPAESLCELPFLHVGLFKKHLLRSVAEEDVLKVLTSSGTTGQAVSRISLDRGTAKAQARVLVKLMQHYLGKDRLPMLVVDHADVVKDRTSFSARGAGILGMMQFGRRPMYALDSSMELDLDGIQRYLDEHGRERVLLFGFTFMVWKHLVAALEERGVCLNIEEAILVHSGGWKKLESERVSPKEFDQRTRAVLGTGKTVNFYGMVEQVGAVFLENEDHYLHTPVYADVLIRDPETLQVVPDGEVGLIQAVSVLPKSYPGHSILTEDLGRIVGTDSNGMLGKYFEVIGRAPRAEVRGCSDTYEQPAEMGGAR